MRNLPMRGQRASPILGALCILGLLVLNPWTAAWWWTADGSVDSLVERLSILVGDAVLALLGGYLLLRRRTLRMREVAFAAIPLLVTVAALELGMRFLAPNEIIERSSFLGWQPRANARLYNEAGTLIYSSTANGFIRYGETNTRRLKVFVLGDSFTQAAVVPAYYDELVRGRSDVELFVYGANGYGTLQELMVLERFLDEIAPDVILWQLCRNDLIDNLFELDRKHWVNNITTRRPYLEDGRIEYRTPGVTASLPPSVVLRQIAFRLHVLRNRGTERLMPPPIGPDDPLFPQAVDVTSELLARVKRRAGATPVVAFSVNGLGAVADTFAALARRQGLHFVAGVPEAIDQAKRDGQAVDYGPQNDHWTPAGHVIAARVLLDYLTEHGFFH